MSTMAREGSGTSWLPDSSPMFMVHRHNGPWMLMAHDNAFLQYFDESGDRGAHQTGSINWLMGMAERNAGRGQLAFRGMISLEPWTIRACGYPDLLASGELCDGEKIHDRQHPHDLFMELSARYDAPLAGGLRWQLYGGPAAEPALGPVAYPHRVSAMPNPLAPMTHHWFDSTHVSFGVVTGGVYAKRWKVEGSAFNGREPDENRKDFDFGALDSYSARLWIKPAERWEFQVSTGHLTDPEALEEGNVQRTTASGSWFAQDGSDYNAVTAGYGINVTDHGNRQAGFLEATRRRGATAVFGRAEVLQVETALLLQDAIPPTDDAAEASDVVGAFTAGMERDVLSRAGFSVGLGAAMTVYTVPSALKGAYSDNPVSFQLFFRLRPPAGAMGRMWNMRMIGH